MNGVFALLFLLLISSAHAGLDLPDFDPSCSSLFLNVPGAIVLDDPMISGALVTRIEYFHSTLKTLLKRRDYSFSTDRRELAEFTEFLEPNHELSRPQIEAMLSALVQLRALIFFQSDLASDYENWVGKIELKKSKPMPVLRLFSKTKVDPENRTIGGKSLESWKTEGARQSWARIESDTLALRNIPYAPQGLRTNHEDLNAHHARVPEAFMRWIRAHAQIADFYSVPRSQIYYELVAELDIAYAEPIAH